MFKSDDKCIIFKSLTVNICGDDTILYDDNIGDIVELIDMVFENYWKVLNRKQKYYQYVPESIMKLYEQ